MSFYIPLHQMLPISTLLLSFYHLTVGNLDVSTWKLPFDIYIPFKIESVIGWYILWLIEFSTTFCYSIPTSTATSYFLCNCVYIFAICDHFNAIICSIKEDIERNRQEKNPIKHRKRCERIRANLNKSVDVHAKIFEWVHRFNYEN